MDDDTMTMLLMQGLGQGGKGSKGVGTLKKKAS